MKLPRENGSIAYRSTPPWKVRPMVGFGSVHVELWVSRLVWYAQLAKYPEEHEGVLAVLIGRFSWQERCGAHIWVRQ
eukprot:1324422-Alexandrium_andersonii.AAC.1